MEENKNNAVEKVENVIKELEQKNLVEGQEVQPIMAEDKELQREQALREQERIMAERRVEEARQKAKEEKERNYAKMQAKRERQNKREERRKQKEEQGSKKKGYITAIVSLSVATLILASVLTATYLMPKQSELSLEGIYQKSFYDTVKQVDNIDTSLAKAIYSSDEGAISGYLLDTAINSELAENDISQLPLKDQSKFYTTKLINQIGDYTKYLNKKLANGKSLSTEDRENLKKLYSANKKLKESLQKTSEKMGPDFSFTSMGDSDSGNIVIDNFNQLQNMSSEFPELIYDGPFSDGIDNREIKGLKGAQINSSEGLTIFKHLFSDYELKDIKEDGMSSGYIECYDYYAMVKDSQLYAQISKQGGKLIMFSYAGSCNEEKISKDIAIIRAQEFLQKQNLTDMKPVWINLSNNVYTINFAYEQNGVIVYSDLIKVRVCAETEMVIGFEATGYYTNHVSRNIGKASLTESQAVNGVSKDIFVQSSRLCLVPIGNTQEVLCYEFNASAEDGEYYVYIDAISGRQVQMFKVISSNEGELLI